MKNINRTVIAASLAIASVLGASKGLVYQNEKIRNLEEQLSHAQSKIETVQLERNDYRRQLIENGNPEGWETAYDEWTGNKYFSRFNGDGLGGYWQEYLANK